MTKSTTSTRRSVKRTSQTKGKRAGASHASSSLMAARSSSTKPSNKRRVLKKSPGAWLWFREGSDDYIIMPKGGYIVFQALGSGDTPRQAWADAARQLRRVDSSALKRDDIHDEVKQ